MNKSLQLLIIALWVLLQAACHRDATPGNPENPVNDAETVTAGISGIVINESNAPVANAQVQAGGQTTITNQYGWFRFSNISLSKTNATVKVQYNGYFTAFRTFYATQNRSHHIRIKLLSKTNSGSFNAGTGGIITLAGGANMEIPAAAIADAAGNPYSGTVNVAMTWINPADADMLATMPGDLRGVAASGAERALESFGMIGTELTGSGGQPLKIAAGKTAKLTFPLPALLQASAPATIALWHFDEAAARWKEEGAAVKAGGSYVANVSHFSFWNCDYPFPIIYLNMTLVNGDNQPLNNAPVRIRRVNTGPGGTVGTGFTDSLGRLTAGVPANEPMVLEVMGTCGNLVYQQNIGPFANHTSLGTVVVNIPASGVFTVTGQVTDCAGAPVSNGTVILFQPNGFYKYSPVLNGSFSTQLLNCAGAPMSFTAVAIDNATQQQSNAVGGSGTTGTVNLGTLQACSATTSEFIQITIDGTQYNWTSPPDTMAIFTVVLSGFIGPNASIYTHRNIGGQSATAGFSFAYPVMAPATYPLRNCILNLGAINSGTIVTTAPLVNVTELGPAGTGFMAGNYSIQMAFAAPPNIRTVNCQFRLRRY